MLSAQEQLLLEIFKKKQLVKKSELMKILNRRDLRLPFSVAQSLLDKGLIASINPLGEKSYAITKTGTRVLKEI